MASRAETLWAAILAQSFPVTVRRGQWRLTLTSASLGENRVTLNGSLTQSGQVVPISWPVIIVNPPTLVTDPQGSVTRTTTDPVTGEETTLRYREDPWEALVATFVDLTRQVQDGVI